MFFFLFLKKAIHSNYFQIQVSRCYASTKLRVLQGAVVSPQWKWLWKNNLRKMGCEITVEFNSCLCHCRSAPSYTLFRLLRPSSSFSFHSTWQKESGIVGMQDCCHSAPIKPLQMEEDRKTFCFCCFFSIFFLSVFLTSYRKLGIRAAHQAGPHNCLLCAGQLLGFHLQLASVRFHH